MSVTGRVRLSNNPLLPGPQDFDFEILIEDTASQPSQVQSNDDVSSESESEKEEE